MILIITIDIAQNEIGSELHLYGGFWYAGVISEKEKLVLSISFHFHNNNIKYKDKS